MDLIYIDDDDILLVILYIIWYMYMRLYRRRQYRLLSAETRNLDNIDNMKVCVKSFPDAMESVVQEKK